MHRLKFEINEQNLLYAINLCVDEDLKAEYEKQLVALYDAYYGDES